MSQLRAGIMLPSLRDAYHSGASHQGKTEGPFSCIRGSGSGFALQVTMTLCASNLLLHGIHSAPIELQPRDTSLPSELSACSVPCSKTQHYLSSAGNTLFARTPALSVRTSRLAPSAQLTQQQSKPCKTTGGSLLKTRTW